MPAGPCNLAACLVQGGFPNFCACEVCVNCQGHPECLARLCLMFAVPRSLRRFQIWLACVADLQQPVFTCHEAKDDGNKLSDEHTTFQWYGHC